MTDKLINFETLERKEIDGTHELSKIRGESGRLGLFLGPKGSRSGAYFGGHNWEELGQHPGIVGEYYEAINSRADFTVLSTMVRDALQTIIESEEK